MKATKWVLVFCSLSLSLSLCAQTVPRVGSVTSDDGYQVTRRGPNERILSKITWKTNQLGRLVAHTNSYVEIATGLHYRDSSGEWRDSDPSFELADDGYAVASKCQHQLIISPNLNAPDGVVVDLQMPDGQRLRSGILGLNLFDPVSGKSIQVAAARDVNGTLVSSNEIVWFDAFDGLKADVRVRNERGQFHQDVLLRERLSVEQLRGLGFDPATVRLEVWTEFVAAPEPIIQRKVMSTETNASLRANMAAPDEVDESVDFGTMRMPIASGRAFVERESHQSPRIIKEWKQIGQRRFLIESIGYDRLLPLLQSVPLRTASLTSEDSPFRMAAGHRPPARSAAKAGRETEFVGIAQVERVAPSGPAVVLDYQIINGGIGNYSFRGDTTYYISGWANGGAISVEGGAVLKFARGAGLWAGTVDCRTAEYRPAILTAKDDNSVGEVISGSTGAPTGYYAGTALGCAQDGVTLRQLRIKYAYYGIYLETDAWWPWGTDVIRDVQMVNCAYGFAGYSSGVIRPMVLENVLFSDVGSGFSMYDVNVVGEHWTVHNCNVLADDWGGVDNWYTVRNSVFSEVNSLSSSAEENVEGSHNGFHNSPVFGSPHWETQAPPFQSVGAGSYYLAGSEFRDVGTWQINSDLLRALKRKTTHPPTLLGGPIQYDTTLYPHAQRDTREGDLPDLGYHYEPIDYLVSELVVGEYQILTLRNGVAIAAGSGDYAFSLSSGARFQSTGTPGEPNRILFRNAIQEQSAGAARVYWSLASPNGTAAALALQFTSVFSLSGAGWWFDNSEDVPHAIIVRDCEIQGGTLACFDNYGGRTLELKNNLFERTRLFLSDENSTSFELAMFNNLFWRGSAFFQKFHNASWEVHDNNFDNVQITYEDAFDYHSHNAYINCSPLPDSLGGDKVLSWLSYQSGPRGNYYLPSASTLIDGGSRSAVAADLSNYTTRTDQTPDSDNVDIGYHYYIGGEPTAYGGSAQTCRNQAVEIVLTGFDPDGDLLKHIVVGQPQHGTLNPATGTSERRLYTPSPGYEGSDSFTFKVNDGFFDSSPATVMIEVGYAPTANPRSDLQTCKGTPLQITLTGSDGCDEPSTLEFSKVTNPDPAQGSLGAISSIDATSASVLFTPNPSFCGDATFTFKVNDGVRDSDPGTVSITVGKKPSADSATVWTCKNTPLNFTLTGSDPCSQTPVFAHVSGSGPHHAQSFSLSANGSVSYTPAVGFTGQDSFQSKVLGDCEESGPATITIQVDQTPIAQCQDVMVKKGETIAFNLTASGGEPLTFSLVPDSGPEHAQPFSLSPSGQVSYTPQSAYEGTDGFNFTVSSCGQVSPLAHVTINVVPSPLLAATCGADRILLRWVIPAWVDGLVTDFQIKRKLAGGTYSVIATVPADARSYVDTAASPGVTYCYVVVMRRQDPCTSVYYAVDSNEVCIQTCSEPPCNEPTISEWVFTDEGFIGGNQQGAFRSYTDPLQVTASPWSFPSSSASLKLRIEYEDDANCTSPFFNPNIQIATAEAVISVASGCPALLTVNWQGMVEQQNSGYERMWLYVNGNLIAYAQSTQGQQNCAPMLPVSGSQQVPLPPGLHLFRIVTDTGTDGQYHFDAYYEFDITLQPD